MSTCEELAAEIAELQAALIVDDASIQAAQNIKTNHQMQLWYAQYNYSLQGCDGSGGGTMAASGESVAATEIKRTPEELALMKLVPDLWRKHQMWEELNKTD